MSLKTSIIRVFSANFLSMISGILIGFVVPAVLSVDGYSNLKTYTFYISYVGFLHLGFIDGMYIKYGGKNREEINKAEFKLEHRIFMFTQIIFTVIFILISLLRADLIMFLMAISIIPINNLSFHKLFYQAIGEFKKYANISYLYTIIYLILNILLAVILVNRNYVLYCLTSIISNGIVSIYLEIRYFKIFRGIKTAYTFKVWQNIKVGFFILLGNLSVMLFYGLDRWFVKIFYTANDFAYYSFAISMLNVINILVGAVSVTFYNYLAQGEDKLAIKNLKKYLIILGGFASLGFFAFSAIINIILKKYIPALDIISISFAAYPYMIVINALFVNLYKARKNEKKYLKVVISMLVISFIYNFIAINISSNSISIAIATTLAFITWYIYSAIDFDYLRPTKFEVIFLTINLFSFIILSHYFNWLLGGLGYLLIIIFTTIVCFNDEYSNIIKFFRGKINKQFRNS